MNPPTTPLLAPPGHRRGLRIITGLAVAICSALAGCVNVEGGAVELSWSLRDGNDDKLTCAEARISEIRICWEPKNQIGPEGAECREFWDFPCDVSRGVSIFDIQEGEIAFFVQPRCEGDDGQSTAARPDKYQVPPPILRQVERGKVVTLNQILILVSEPNCLADECTCP